jgi:hypothetical protein
MMSAYRLRAAFAASTLAIAAFGLAPAAAQVVSGGTQGGVSGQDVDASTCGYGSTDSSSVTVGGCADAEARNGGTADTSTRAKTNSRMGMQRSVATARDEDERARSRTMTKVRQGEVVRSRTMSMYKQRGERPVREVVTSTSKPQPGKKPR